MDISVFEVIGPVMLGPSSSGTAGMARLGYAAGKFLDAPLERVHFTFHPRNEDYAGLRSHFALMGGILGIREYDPRLQQALQMAQDRGISLSAGCFADPLPENGLTVGIEMTQQNGQIRRILGVSVGGGSIDILEIDGFKVKLASTERHLFVWADREIGGELARILPQCTAHMAAAGGKYLFYMGVSPALDEGVCAEIMHIAGATKAMFCEPFLSLGYVPHEPLLTTYGQLIAMSESTGHSAAELAVSYEMNRSGKTREQIWEAMKHNLVCMRESAEYALENGVETLFGFASGRDGQKMRNAVAQGKTMGGATQGKAIAIALATLEMDCSMNRVVAAPTGGSCGIVPGCLLAAQEERGFSDDKLVEALFVAALMGVIMFYHKASFSGMAGGCQAEIGVSSAMAAAALAHLAGGDAKTICHAMAFSMKNTLGLICDRIGTSSEIPCVRRNAMGVANAFSGCDLALAGMESYIPPDEVIEALVNVQKLLPPQLKGGCGGLASTKTAQKAREIEAQLSRSFTLPDRQAD